MTEREPTELERAVARALLKRRSYGNFVMSETRMVELLSDPHSNELAAESVRAAFLDARAAIAEIYRHLHTDRSIPCPLCGFRVQFLGPAPARPYKDEP